MNVRLFIAVLQILEDIFILFILFFVFCSNWIISTDLASGSLVYLSKIDCFSSLCQFIFCLVLFSAVPTGVSLIHASLVVNHVCVQSIIYIEKSLLQWFSECWLFSSYFHLFFKLNIIYIPSYFQLLFQSNLIAGTFKWQGFCSPDLSFTCINFF